MATRLSRLCSFQYTTRQHVNHGSISSQEFESFLESLVQNFGELTKIGDGYEVNNYSEFFRDDDPPKDFNVTNCMIKTLNDLNDFLTLVEIKLAKKGSRTPITKKIFVQGFCFKYDYFSMVLMVHKGFMTHDFMIEFLIKKYGLSRVADLLELSRRQFGEALFFRGLFDKILENKK